MNKVRLKLDDHKIIAKELHRIRHEILKIGIKVLNAYPLKDKNGSKLLNMVDTIDHVRGKLESIMFSDFDLSKDPNNLKIYYPGTNIEFKV